MTHILVLNKRDSFLERRLGGLFDIRLGVPDRLGENGDDVRHGQRHLLGSGNDELLEHIETSSLDLPFPSSLDLVQECGKNDGGSPWVHRLDNGLDGGQCGLFDFCRFVCKCLEEGREWAAGSRSDDIGLEQGGSAIFAQRGNGRACTFAYSGRFLVAQGLEKSTCQIRLRKLF